MKMFSLLTAGLVLTLLLTACASGSASTNANGSGGTSGNASRSNRSSTPLSPEAKLALGTIKLESTKQAVDPAMAAKLIPLWQLMVQLKSSNSAAPQEVTAVLDQVKLSMHPDQLSSINSMTLTQADLFTAFQGQSQADGSGTGTDPGGQGASRSNRGGGGGFFFGGGPGPGGGFGGGGFGGSFAGGARINGGAGANGGSSASSSLTAAQAAQARQNAISSLVIDQLIRLLQSKLRS